MSDDEGLFADGGGGGFPTAGAQEFVDFGFEEDASKKMTGRRKKLQRKVKPGSFETLGLSEPVLKAIKRKGYRLPTPIQRKTLPLILQGLDVVGMARTGSGKTAAFIVPMVEKLKAHSGRSGARAVILSPTRELALQTHKVVKELGRHTDLRTAVLVGGDSMEAQFAELAAFPDILVATPGRLMHHLQEVEGMSLKAVEYLVFDEADRLFEMGFSEQLKEILSHVGPARQTLLFSATMPSALAEFARAGLKEPELVRLDADTKISPDLALAFFTVRAEDKPAALLYLLREVLPQEQPTIVFTSTRHHVEFLSGLLAKEGLDSAMVHGTMDQAARKISIAKFRAGKVRTLIVTDVAARGIDIPLLDNVVNYDFPPKPKLFVHRSGRAARAGRVGTSYSLLTRDELPFLLDLHLFLSRPLRPATVQGIREAAAEAAAAGPSGSAGQGSCYGTFPQAALDDAVNRVRAALASSHDLEMQKGSTENAFRLYCKTRPPAAQESVKRAKTLPKEGIHPLLAAALPSDALGGLEAQAGLAEIAAALKSYRPSQTVFEAEVSSARKGQGAGVMAMPGMLAAAPYERRVEVMRQKRQAHAATIEASRRRGEGGARFASAATGDVSAPGPPRARKVEEEEQQGGSSGDEEQRGAAASDSDAEAAQRRQGGGGGGRKRKQFVLEAEPEQGKYREAGFFISHTPAENDTDEKFYALGDAGFKDAVLDLTAEDADGMRAQSRQASQFHWDKRSKKYVKLQANETIKAGKRVKTESGAKGKATTGLYEKWSKKTRLRVAPGGAEEAGERLAAQMSDRFKKGGRGWANPFKKEVANAGVREELRNPDQVRKMHKQEQRKKEHLQRRKSERMSPEDRKGGKGAFKKGGGGGGGGGGFKRGGSGGGGFERGGGGGGGFKKGGGGSDRGGGGFKKGGGGGGGGGGFKGKGGGGGGFKGKGGGGGLKPRGGVAKGGGGGGKKGGKGRR